MVASVVSRTEVGLVAARGGMVAAPLADGKPEARRVSTAKAEIAFRIMSAHTHLLRGEYAMASRQALSTAEKAKKEGIPEKAKLAAETYLRAEVMRGCTDRASRIAGTYGLSHTEIDRIISSAEEFRPIQPEISREWTGSRREILDCILAAHVFIDERQYETAAGNALGAAEKAYASGLNELMRLAAELYLRAEVLKYNTSIGEQRVERYGLSREEAGRIIKAAEAEREKLPKPWECGY